MHRELGQHWFDLFHVHASARRAEVGQAQSSLLQSMHEAGALAVPERREYLSGLHDNSMQCLMSALWVRLWLPDVHCISLLVPASLAMH